MAKHPCAAYLKQVKRKLRCAGETKRALLSGVEQELAEAFPQGAAPSPAQILDRFGPPEDLARELEAAIPPEELERVRKRRRLLVGLAFAVCAVVIAILICYLIWLATHDVKYIDTEIFYT